MEKHPFDTISKEMADSTISRGKALKLVGAAILGGAFAGLFPATAEARRITNRRRTLVFCGTGSFNFLNNCRNSAGQQFSCSSNFGGLGGSVTCNSGGTRY